VFAGVDYARVLAAAEEEGDIIIWDGGNNDTPFFKPDVHVVMFDPHRAGHERLYHPGETNMRMADIAVIGKVDSAADQQVRELRAIIQDHAPAAEVVLAETEITVTDGESILGKRVLVIEDGPTVTHGGMAFGAGTIAAKRYGAAELIDPRPWAVGSLSDAFDAYPHLNQVLPAIGYGDAMTSDLETTVNAVDCDMVLCATPTDLTRIISVNKPVVRVRYEYRDHGEPTLEACVTERLKRLADST
jgi:predicted GTPase